MSLVKVCAADLLEAEKQEVVDSAGFRASYVLLVVTVADPSDGFEWTKGKLHSQLVREVQPVDAQALAVCCHPLVIEVRWKLVWQEVDDIRLSGLSKVMVKPQPMHLSKLQLKLRKLG